MNPKLTAKISSLTRGVCHRGLHDLYRPENSLGAFANAIEQGLPFECDVHLTKDHRLIVCHDSNLLRLCGKEGIIEELTLEQIQKDYPLFDGSFPPEFSEVLRLNQGKVPMVIELKAYQDNAATLASVIVPLINEMPNADECYLISFSADALRSARLFGVKTPVGLLVGTEAVKHADDALLREFDFLDVEVHYSLLPRFHKYRKEGGALMCWTVKSRLTYRIGKARCDALTWEEVDSAKEKRKVNSFIRGKLDPRKN